MVWILLGIVLFIVLALLILKVKTQVEQDDISDYPYTKQEILFSPGERSFFGVLTQAIGDKAKIFGKVRVADVITPKKGIPRAEWQKAFNKISGKHFDFILCDKDDLSIICAIELDDSSHQSKNRQQRDLFLQSASKAASVPLHHVQARSTYNLGEIKGLFSTYFSSDELVGDNIKGTTSSIDISGIQPSSTKKEEKICPKCSTLLVKRVAKKGKNAGDEFWACNTFPKCKYTESINKDSKVS